MMLLPIRREGVKLSEHSRGGKVDLHQRRWPHHEGWQRKPARCVGDVDQALTNLHRGHSFDKIAGGHNPPSHSAPSAGWEINDVSVLVGLELAKQRVGAVNAAREGFEAHDPLDTDIPTLVSKVEKSGLVFDLANVFANKDGIILHVHTPPGSTTKQDVGPRTVNGANTVTALTAVNLGVFWPSVAFGTQTASFRLSTVMTGPSLPCEVVIAGATLHASLPHPLPANDNNAPPDEAA